MNTFASHIQVVRSSHSSILCLDHGRIRYVWLQAILSKAFNDFYTSGLHQVQYLYASRNSHVLEVGASDRPLDVHRYPVVCSANRSSVVGTSTEVFRGVKRRITKRIMLRQAFEYFVVNHLFMLSNIPSPSAGPSEVHRISRHAYQNPEPM